MCRSQEFYELVQFSRENTEKVVDDRNSVGRDSTTIMPEFFGSLMDIPDEKRDTN